MKVKKIKKIILSFWKNKKLNNITKYTKKVLRLLEKNKIRIVNFKKGIWKTNIWIKKAILLHIENSKNKIYKGKNYKYIDKFSDRHINFSDRKIYKKNIRISKGAVIREGSYIGKNTVLMPCFINVGANISKNTMIDTWSTIGSCAKIGKNVHISGGCGIGGVLEPIQNNPVIIEDKCFIGARSEIVEGIIVKKGTVVSMGVFIGKSTKIFDRTNDRFITNNIIPKNSVIVAGSIPYKNYSLYSAIIVKNRDENTNKKIKIDKRLR